ncbi:ester cyclase [Geodermatophilus sp. SYSU D00691]
MSSLAGTYRRYNAACNAHRFDELGEFVHDELVVNGERSALADYAEGLRAVVRAFPDYRWEIEHLLVDGDVVAAHFTDTGTHRGEWLGVPATGRRVTAREFAFYRWAGGRIAEVWVTADDLGVLEQLRAP